MFPPGDPSLPAFQTLLISGAHAASAPIHLCISHLTENLDGQVVFLTPSRQHFIASLESYNDEWLNKNSGRGRIAQALSKIKVFYIPTPGHMALLLSSLRTTISDTCPYLPLLTMDQPPSLLLLHNISALLAGGKHTVSSYLNMVIQGIVCLQFLSSSTPRPSVGTLPQLVLFDSGLEHLDLPILLSPDGNEDDKLEPVLPLVQRYFNWVGLVEKRKSATVVVWRSLMVILVEGTPPSSPSGTYQSIAPTHRMRLYQPEAEDSSRDVSWQWTEERGEETRWGGPRGTRFRWE